MDNQICVCDACGADFILVMESARGQHPLFTLSYELEANYFTCPECGKVYLCYVTDLFVRQRQQHVRRMWERLHRTKNPDSKQRIKDQIDHEQKLIAERMDELKSRM